MNLSRKLRSVENGGIMYWCQGCETTHLIYVGDGTGTRWEYNGNPDRPTFTPSVLVTTGHYVEYRDDNKKCWCTMDWDEWGKKYPDEPRRKWQKCVRCHTFITDGMVQFLSDCTHQYAGQTLPLPDLPTQLLACIGTGEVK